MLTRIEISKSALMNNVKIFKELCPESRFMAVVKSNAYGHGLKETVGVLMNSVDCFGVNSINEALAIREIDTITPVLVMGRDDEDCYKHLSERSIQNIGLVLSRIEEIITLNKVSPDTPFHLKADTGMGRLGFNGEELEKVFIFLESHPDLAWEGLMTHFANVEDVTDRTYARIQFEQFERIIKRALRAAGSRNLLSHIAASASAMLLPESRLEMIRVGISLYGIWPSEEARISMHAEYRKVPELKPVMRWVTKIVHLKTVPANACIGYGCTYRTPVETRIAVLPVGYFEGYERALSNRSYVLIHGKRARLVGRVCMNMIMADVGHIPESTPGDDAVLIGESGDERITADELAKLTSTINYEVVTRIQCDLPRVVVE